MESRKYILLLAYLTTILGFSISDKDHSRGRKLFGGYRIVPKVCQPTNPSRLKSNQPAICMFNYECGQRNGQVVGACMDGFLFGACCQLPSNYQTIEILQEQFNFSKIPVNLKPDEEITTIQPTTSQFWDKTKIAENTENVLSETFDIQNDDDDDLSASEIITQSDSNDMQEKEIPQVDPVTTFLRPDQILQISDPVDQLPGFFSQGIGASNYSGAETVLIDKNGTVIDNKINSDSLFRPGNRSTLLPNYSASTEGSTTRMQPMHYMNTNRISDSTTISSTSDLVRVPTINYETSMEIKKNDDEFNKEEIAINHIISILNGSTPNGNSPTHVTQQIIPSSGASSVQSWVTIENTSKPSTSRLTYPYTYYKPVTKPTNYYHYNVGSSSSSFGSSIKMRPTRPSNLVFSSDYSPKYPSTGSSSSSSTYFLSTKPTTLPPAPTVIVLGPLGTSDFTSATTKAATKRPIITSSTPKPSVLTKKPPQATITHNISTVISTDSSADASATSNIISTSFINVKFQETSTSKPSENLQTGESTKKPPTIWTTLSTWSSKPSFHMKPGQPNFNWPDDHLPPMHNIILKKPENPISSTVNVSDDDGTAAPDDMSNFPPDRNPNLGNSTPISQAEKPTVITSGYPAIEIISENEIPTPSFIEDVVLTNKVDDFVNKIVDSLQDNFHDLKDIVYKKKNISVASTAAPTSLITKRPTTVKKPIPKPSSTKKPPTRRPASSPKPGVITNSGNKPAKVTKPARPSSTNAPLSAGVITKRPAVTASSQTGLKKPKPTKKVTTTVTPSTTVEISSISTELHSTQASIVENDDGTTRTPDYRRECGVRPLVKKGRVVGGKSATFGEWPWQVLVREATWLGLFTKNKCGGVLITDKYVITAAHCQPGFLASLVAVFGEFDISGELESRRSISRNVRRVIVHRAYNPATFENDLAILELESPIEFDAHIVPICMPDDGIDFTGKVATVTGWGRVKYNGGVPSVLQEVQVPIIENAVCQDMFRTAGHSKLILDSFLCAGYANGQKDSCEGDSGGPLMMERPDGKWFLVGTVSHGIKCAAPYLPGVYMRTTYFKPWLHSVTGV